MVLVEHNGWVRWKKHFIFTIFDLAFEIFLSFLFNRFDDIHWNSINEDPKQGIGDNNLIWYCCCKNTSNRMIFNFNLLLLVCTELCLLEVCMVMLFQIWREKENSNELMQCSIFEWTKYKHLMRAYSHWFCIQVPLQCYIMQYCRV